MRSWGLLCLCQLQYGLVLCPQTQSKIRKNGVVLPEGVASGGRSLSSLGLLSLSWGEDALLPHSSTHSPPVPMAAAALAEGHGGWGRSPLGQPLPGVVLPHICGGTQPAPGADGRRSGALSLAQSRHKKPAPLDNCFTSGGGPSPTSPLQREASLSSQRSSASPSPTAGACLLGDGGSSPLAGRMGRGFRSSRD